jgi:dipeptidyl aminopeptidase/acylaminoacyl peptidase
VTLDSSGAITDTRQLTAYPHPYPQLRDMNKEVLRYERGDGVGLTGTLYTPPGYEAARDGRLPTLLWAYPREYKSKVGAGTRRGHATRGWGLGQSSGNRWSRTASMCQQE